MRVNDILGTIGHTPLVRINRLNSGRSEVWAKLEKENPGGSVKDRVAKQMIKVAERRGLLREGMTILEATSGNTGIGLAMAGAVKGYKVKIVMPEGVSSERREIIEAFGAEVLLSPASEGTAGAIRMVREMGRGGNYFIPDQFSNLENVEAHYRTTADEIWKDTRGCVTHFVAGIGTSGTVMGVARGLWEHNPGITVVGVEPRIGHKIQGLRNMGEPESPGIFDASALDEVVRIDDEDAFRASRLLAKREGLLVGISSGAAMHVALEKSEDAAGAVIVALLPDGGERYMSTGLFTCTG